MKLKLSFLLSFICSVSVFCQQSTTPELSKPAAKKTINAFRATESIAIDGKLNETSWNSAQIATDFVMFQPDNGKPIPIEKKTEVKVIYDNEAIYI